MTLVNIGCGSVFHPAWVNLDLSPPDPAVRRWEARRGLPFTDSMVDVCYASHVLEHLEPERGAQLLGDCYRVLKPGGIVRIVVPDLEVIAQLYLENLALAAAGSRDGELRYDWMVLELLDQITRTESGGRMARYLATGGDDDTKAFIRSRVGDETLEAAQTELSADRSGTLVRALARPGLAFRRAREEILIACATLLLGSRGARAVHEGLFRRSGEAHVWMYDRFSLVRALHRAAFANVQRRSAGESAIPEFAKFQLELRQGKPRKPDSLYVEGIKPASSAHPTG